MSKNASARLESPRHSPVGAAVLDRPSATARASRPGDTRWARWLRQTTDVTADGHRRESGLDALDRGRPCGVAPGSHPLPAIGSPHTVRRRSRPFVRGSLTQNSAPSPSGSSRPPRPATRGTKGSPRFGAGSGQPPPRRSSRTSTSRWTSSTHAAGHGPPPPFDQCRVATGDAAFVLNARSTTSCRAPERVGDDDRLAVGATRAGRGGRVTTKPFFMWRIRISAVLPLSDTTSVTRLVTGSRTKPMPMRRAVAEVGGVDDIDHREHVPARAAADQGEDDQRRTDQQRHAEDPEDGHQDGIAVERRAARPGRIRDR